jgi:hypothetical protein
MLGGRAKTCIKFDKGLMNGLILKLQCISYASFRTPRTFLQAKHLVEVRFSTLARVWSGNVPGH